MNTKYDLTGCGDCSGFYGASGFKGNLPLDPPFPKLQGHNLEEVKKEQEAQKVVELEPEFRRISLGEE